MISVGSNYSREEGVPHLAAEGDTVCSVEGWFSCLYSCMFGKVELGSSLGLRPMVCVRIAVLDYPMVCPVVL